MYIPWDYLLNSNTKKKTKCILIVCSLSAVFPTEQSWILVTLGVQ